MTNRDKFLAILSVLVDNDKYDIEQCMKCADYGITSRGFWAHVIDKTCAALDVVPEPVRICAFFCYDRTYKHGDEVKLGDGRLVSVVSTTHDNEYIVDYKGELMTKYESELTK